MAIFDVESVIDNLFDKKEEYGLQKRLKRDEDEYLKHKKKFNQFAVIINDDLLVHGYEVDLKPGGEEDIRTKKIMEDWKLLKEGLPGTIFVRAYKEEDFYLQAVIVGEPGTPFHDGLFFFKITFPASYPNEPPEVTYHSQGLELHRKLGWHGKVRLCVLKKKKWNAKSNVLRVLMSIQERILNSKPYFDKLNKRILPEWIYKKQSVAYNQETFRLNCETMLEVKHNPPKDFEFFVAQHFRDRTNTIRRACLAYIDGQKVGSPIQDDVCSTISDHNDSSTISADYDSSSSDASSSSPESSKRRKASKVVESKPSLPSKAVTLKSKKNSKAATSKSKNIQGFKEDIKVFTEDLSANCFQEFKRNGPTLDYSIASY